MFCTAAGKPIRRGYMISGFDEETFRTALHKYFTPAQPISEIGHLHGREGKVKAIGRALSSPGKHVFIHGDRGVGKTSLAKTALQLHLKGAKYIPIVACENNSNFYELVDAIRRQIATYQIETEFAEVNILEATQLGNSGLALPTMRNINDAVEAVSYTHLTLPTKA